MDDKAQLGSQTARGGFRNEDFVISCFNSWQTNDLARAWLETMKYNLQEIEYVQANKVKGSYKADVQVEIKISIKLKNLTDVQNLQVKLVSNPQGFNQIDKRWVKNYQELWNMPENVLTLLKHFTGELSPKIPNPRDSRRMFADEFLIGDQEILLNFLNENKTLIVTDILKGRGKFSAEWMLVILNVEGKDLQWALKPMNVVLNHYGNGDIIITDRGSFKIGRITMQRKGGDAGRNTAKMLQFKINPCEII
ncbi:MAG: type II restriction endonuclease [Candidatus Gracilibacteria bacterium]|nr:type II restriction endonuclease [Candidatus Gracilibacteria bacterium]